MDEGVVQGQLVTELNHTKTSWARIAMGTLCLGGIVAVVVLLAVPSLACKLFGMRCNRSVHSNCDFLTQRQAVTVKNDFPPGPHEVPTCPPHFGVCAKHVTGRQTVGGGVAQQTQSVGCYRIRNIPNPDGTATPAYWNVCPSDPTRVCANEGETCETDAEGVTYCLSMQRCDPNDQVVIGCDDHNPCPKDANGKYFECLVQSSKVPTDSPYYSMWRDTVQSKKFQNVGICNVQGGVIDGDCIPFEQLGEAKRTFTDGNKHVPDGYLGHVSCPAGNTGVSEHWRQCSGAIAQKGCCKGVASKNGNPGGGLCPNMKWQCAPDQVAWPPDEPCLPTGSPVPADETTAQAMDCCNAGRGIPSSTTGDPSAVFCCPDTPWTAPDGKAACMNVSAHPPHSTLAFGSQVDLNECKLNDKQKTWALENLRPVPDLKLPSADGADGVPPTISPKYVGLTGTGDNCRIVAGMRLPEDDPARGATYLVANDDETGDESSWIVNRKNCVIASAGIKFDPAPFTQAQFSTCTADIGNPGAETYVGLYDHQGTAGEYVMRLDYNLVGDDDCRTKNACYQTQFGGEAQGGSAGVSTDHNLLTGSNDECFTTETGDEICNSKSVNRVTDAQGSHLPVSSDGTTQCTAHIDCDALVAGTVATENGTHPWGPWSSPTPSSLPDNLQGKPTPFIVRKLPTDATSGCSTYTAQDQKPSGGSRPLPPGTTCETLGSVGPFEGAPSWMIAPTCVKKKNLRKGETATCELPNEQDRGGAARFGNALLPTGEVCTSGHLRGQECKKPEGDRSQWSPWSPWSPWGPWPEAVE